MNFALSLFRRFWSWLGPSRKGRWHLPGLEQNVEVLYDPHGVPHVLAGSLPDALLVQGYLHARERAFQMDLQRRIGQGRLAEILGPSALPADRFLRRLGLWHRTLELWPQMEPRVQSLLTRYATGVNLGFQRLKPLECWLLGSRLETWTALHSLLWTQVMAFDMGSNWESEWVRWKLLQRLGVEDSRRFHLEHPEELPSALGDRCGKVLDGLWQDYQAARAVLEPWMSWGGGSNAWAIAGSRSASGSPLLASDPHLITKVPSSWYEVHLETPQVLLYGASLPGLPGIVIGHNADVSWGITNSYVDTQDLFLERVRGQEVQRADGWQKLKVRQERILVRGGASHLEEVRESSNGPLIFEDSEGLAVALRWCGHEGRDETLSGWFDLLAAQSVASAQKALHRWHNPALNFVLADRHGNIGYQLTGRVPIRRDGHGVLPQAGWETGGEWVGYVAPEELPSSLNPECGYVVSANQAPQQLSGAPYLGSDFCDGYRAQRIVQLIEASQLHTREGLARMQMDTLSLPALELTALLAQVARPDWPSHQLLDELLSWNGELQPESRSAALYQCWLHHLNRAAFQPLLGEELFLYWCGAPVSPVGLVGGHAGRYLSFLIRAWKEQPERNWGRLAEDAWKLALEELERRLGSDPKHWRWGRLHRFQPTHPLAVNPTLASLLNPPPAELGGDVSTVLQSVVLPQAPYQARGWLPSFRLLAELTPVIDAESVLPTGPSGWVGDRHTFSHLKLWLRGKLHPSYTDRRALEISRPDRLVLMAPGRVSLPSV